MGSFNIILHHLYLYLHLLQPPVFAITSSQEGYNFMIVSSSFNLIFHHLYLYLHLLQPPVFAITSSQEGQKPTVVVSVRHRLFKRDLKELETSLQQFCEYENVFGCCE